MDKSATSAPVRVKFSRYEKIVIGILGFLQFTVILDVSAVMRTKHNGCEVLVSLDDRAQL
jgi:hypothetical protein